MKKVILLLTACLFVSFSADSQETKFPKEKEEAIKAILKKYTELGIPGLAITVYSEETGFWSHTTGYANLEKQLPLTEEHLFYLQSVSKTYMAVAILKLYEQGKIDLNAAIGTYLNLPILNSLKGADRITVKMLLNHTSGLPEYSTQPLLVSRIIQDPTTVLSVREMLGYIEAKPMEFEPGARYQYRNTNYLLLSLIADQVTGDHVAFVNREIIKKLKLKATYYLTKDNYQQDLNLVNAYWDVLQESLPANISKLQKANVASMKGDDDLVSTTGDAVAFLKGLVTGKLLKPKTLDLMQEWVKDEEGKPRYGLGVAYYDLDVTHAIGHSGGGIGAGCVLLYLPEVGAIVFIATNFNTMMESPIRKKAENLQMEILLALFGD
ncbi:MAG: serine hydrolase domain-containing protein [Aurantibacter sp.]